MMISCSPACFFSTSLRPFHAAWALHHSQLPATLVPCGFLPQWFWENLCLQMFPTGQSYYSKRKRHNHDIIMYSCMIIYIYLYICYTYNLFPFLVQGFLEACISGGSLPSIYDPWLPAWNLPTQRALQDKMLPKRLKVSYKACKPRLGKKNTYFCKKETSTLLIFHRRSYKTQQNTKIPLNRNTKKKTH